MDELRFIADEIRDMNKTLAEWVEPDEEMLLSFYSFKNHTRKQLEDMNEEIHETRKSVDDLGDTMVTLSNHLETVANALNGIAVELEIMNRTELGMDYVHQKNNIK